MPNEIDSILKKEGGEQNHPADRDGPLPTKFGITAGTLSEWLGRPATISDINALTKVVAAEIYEKFYIKVFDKIPESMLKSNMIDFGVLSGTSRAIINLQEELGVEADGVIGPKTLTALSLVNLDRLNISITKRRVKLVGRLCVKDPSQLAFLNGWLNRILSFL